MSLPAATPKDVFVCLRGNLHAFALSRRAYLPQNGTEGRTTASGCWFGMFSFKLVDRTNPYGRQYRYSLASA